MGKIRSFEKLEFITMNSTASDYLKTFQMRLVVLVMNVIF